MLEVRNESAYDGDQKRITNNKNVMECAMCYENEQPRPKGIMDKINQIRLWKSVILPCEIVGLDEIKTSDCSERDEEKILLK